MAQFELPERFKARNEITYRDSIAPWTISVDISGGFLGINRALALACDLAAEYGFECFTKTHSKFFGFKRITLKVFGNSTEKRANKFKDRLKEILESI